MIAITPDADGQLVAQQVNLVATRTDGRFFSAYGNLEERLARSYAKHFAELATKPSTAAKQSARESTSNDDDGELAASTRSAYKKDLAAFKKWGGTIPCTGDLLAEYVAALSTSCAYATIQRRVHAISYFHTRRSLPSPTTERPVKKAMRIATRSVGTAQRQAKPLTRRLLIRLCQSLGKSAIDRRDRAVLLLGFAGGFRRSEIAALNITDLQFVDEGLLVKVRSSKTDQTKRGRTVAIPKSSGAICAVTAVRRWLGICGTDEDALFRRCHRGGTVQADRLDSAYVAAIVKRRLSAIGVDSTLYSGHSLRAGLVTEAARAGVPAWKIKQQTGHKSDANLGRYIRDAELWQNNAAKRALVRPRR